MSLTQSQRRFLSLYEYSYLIGSEPVTEKKARRAIGTRDFDQYKITAAVSCKVTEPGDYAVVMPTTALTIFVAPMGFGVPRFVPAGMPARARKSKATPAMRQDITGKPKTRRRPGDKGKAAADDAKVAVPKRNSRKTKTNVTEEGTRPDTVAPTRRRIRRRHVIGTDGTDTTTASA